MTTTHRLTTAAVVGMDHDCVVLNYPSIPAAILRGLAPSNRRLPIRSCLKQGNNLRFIMS